MTLSFLVRGKTLLLALLGILLVQQPCLAQELKKVRALLVIDTNSNLKKSVQVDQSHMVTMLCRGIPKEQRDLTVLAGDQATPDHILDYYRNLETDDSEALLFFYAGHGATDPEHGHFLAMEAGGLYRSDLRRAMEAKNAGLVVLLTDCCSNLVPAQTKPVFPHYKAETLQPMYRCLFFQHRGVVDITAATGNAAYGDDMAGGFFTRTFHNAIIQPPDKLDANGDGFLTWSEFFPVVQRDTERAQRRQRPHAYALAAADNLDQHNHGTYQGKDAEIVMSTMKQKGECWVPWKIFREPQKNLVLYRKLRSVTPGADADGNPELTVTAGREYQWRREARNP